VVAAATAAGASAATISAIQAAATSAGSTAGYTPDQIDKDITAAVSVPARAGRPPELRHQRRAVGHPDERRRPCR
jgi:predicted lipoprotein